MLSQYRQKNIRFAEIGVAGGASVVMWNVFFQTGDFYFFDRDQNFLNNAKQFVGSNSKLILMDVCDSNSIINGLEQTGGNLDILLDDSSHNPDDQHRIIHEGLKYVRSGGIIIIEDINRDEPEERYVKILDGIADQFSFISFVITEHENRYSPGWNNDKLLVLIKK